jgi:hypothetical protein
MDIEYDYSYATACNIFRIGNDRRISTIGGHARFDHIELNNKCSSFELYKKLTYL